MALHLVILLVALVGTRHGVNGNVPMVRSLGINENGQIARSNGINGNGQNAQSLGINGNGQIAQSNGKNGNGQIARSNGINGNGQIAQSLGTNGNGHIVRSPSLNGNFESQPLQINTQSTGQQEQPGAPGFISNVGLRHAPSSSISQPSTVGDHHTQSRTSNSVDSQIEDVSALTQRFQYQTVSNREVDQTSNLLSPQTIQLFKSSEISPLRKPIDTPDSQFQSQLVTYQDEVQSFGQASQASIPAHFQTPGMRSSSQIKQSHTQRISDVDRINEIVPPQQFILQATDRQVSPSYSEIPVQSSFPVQGTMHSSEIAGLENEVNAQRFQSQQQEMQQKIGLKVAPSFQPSFGIAPVPTTGVSQSTKLQTENEIGVLAPATKLGLQQSAVIPESETRARPSFPQSASELVQFKPQSQQIVEQLRVQAGAVPATLPVQITDFRQFSDDPLPSTSQFQPSELKLAPSPAVLQVRLEDSTTTIDRSRQFTEEKIRPQIQESSTLTQTRVSDIIQPKKPIRKDETSTDQALQSQKFSEVEVKSQPRFPSAPAASHFQAPGTRKSSGSTSVLTSEREKIVPTSDVRFQSQQLPIEEKDRRTLPGLTSPPLISHFQAAGTGQQRPFIPFTGPIVRQDSSFVTPQRFQTNLFRDVGYASPPVDNRPNVALVRSHTIGPTDERSYAFIFESEDGIMREEQGGYTEPDKGLTAKTGSFSYISPDGTIVETTYIADERGYRSQSAPLARIHDPNLPAGKYDRYRAALSNQARKVRQEQLLNGNGARAQN